MLKVIPGSKPRNQLGAVGRTRNGIHKPPFVPPSQVYLYYAYCVAMLRRAHHQGEHEHNLEGLPGSEGFGELQAHTYERTYLLAFLEEIGADDLMGGAEEGGEGC